MSLKKQKGDFLVESLVGMLLMSIIGVGVVSVTTTVSVSQKDLNLQTIAINQMRSTLMENGYAGTNLCAGTPAINLPGGETVTVLVQGCEAGGIRTTTSATISDPNGVVADVVISGVPKPIIISATSSAFTGTGEIVVGGRWE